MSGIRISRITLMLGFALSSIGCVYHGPRDSRFHSVTTRLDSPIEFESPLELMPGQKEDLHSPVSAEDLISIALRENPEI